MAPFGRRFSPEQWLFLGFLLLSLVLLVADFFRNPVVGFGGYRWFMAGLVVLMLGLIVWTWLGGLRAPASVFIALVFLAFTFVALQWNGVHSVTVTMYILLIFIAVPLLGWGTALVVTGASLVALWALAFLPVPMALPSPQIQARNLTLIFTGVFLLGWWNSRQLRQVADHLRHTNSQLEVRVAERTKQVLVSEKLATVGRLSAGLAHELNTPLGAVTSAHSSAEIALRSGLLLAFHELGGLPTERREFLESLVGRILATRNSALLASSTMVRDRRKLLLQWGLEGEVEPEVCEALAEGVAEVPGLEREEFLNLGRGPDWQVALRLLEATQTLVRSLEVIGRGAKKMALVVRSFQTLSRKEADADPTPTSPLDELESVLVLLQSRMPPTVELKRDYDETVVLLCRPDRLGQVLINLITNALQAMDYKGILELVIRRDDMFGVIEVIDSGPGVPIELQERIFEPFFTTKAPGEGNGLGLDLSRRICHEEGGALSLDQQPRRTRFVIRLPLAERA